MEFAYKGLRLLVPEDVYPPAEDSLMLADAVSELRGRVLEMGCGCGIASLACAKNWRNQVLGVDISPSAVRCAAENAALNNIKNAAFIKSDLFSGVKGPQFDIMLFNPPYLPTKEAERIKGPLNHAFDGGDDGRKVLDRFLRAFDKHLKSPGLLLLVQSSLNDPEATRAKLDALGYNVETAEKKSFFFESIYLLKAIKPSKP